jgi:hypothetical protein
MKTLFKWLKPGFALALAIPCSAPGQDYRIQTLETAHTMFGSATNHAMYAEAARQFEYLVHEEGIHNGPLFYNTGNSWFMAGDIGRAVLNYRRAELFMPGNSDLKHNLEIALEMRKDLVPPRELHPLTARLLGWHLNTSTLLRGWLFALCWICFWSAGFWMVRTTKKEVRVLTVAAGMLSLMLLGSLVTEYTMKRKTRAGVITDTEVLARKGDGDRYAPAFREPLHAGTEFNQLESRNNWKHVRLADGQTCWIPAGAGELVDFR